ncbi:hypothetical protein ATCC90586_006368 [Pythium insidiosum]|nr:hypothetical protein ATCC90586_006368 [Pythium insidiosum]
MPGSAKGREYMNAMDSSDANRTVPKPVRFVHEDEGFPDPGSNARIPRPSSGADRTRPGPGSSRLAMLDEGEKKDCDATDPVRRSPKNKGGEDDSFYSASGGGSSSSSSPRAGRSRGRQKKEKRGAGRTLLATEAPSATDRDTSVAMAARLAIVLDVVRLMVVVDPRLAHPKPSRKSATKLPTPRMPAMALGPRREGDEAQLAALEKYLVQECVEMWSRTPATRVYPVTNGSTAPRSEYVSGPAADVIEHFHKDSWLKQFDVCHTSDPVEPRTNIYEVHLDRLDTVQKIAVLQTALHEAGYAFLNLVHAFANGAPPLAQLLPLQVEHEVFWAMWYLGVEITEWVKTRHVSPPPPGRVLTPPPAETRQEMPRPPANPYAMRSPPSVISSSAASIAEPYQFQQPAVVYQVPPGYVQQPLPAQHPAYPMAPAHPSSGFDEPMVSDPGLHSPSAGPRMWSLSEPEKCRNLEMYLRGIAETWFQQLGDASKSWPKLAEAFQAEFCAPAESAIERYFSIRQRRGETPRQDLWRLNAAAKTPGDMKHHVGRFIKTLSDSDVRTALIGRRPACRVDEYDDVDSDADDTGSDAEVVFQAVGERPRDRDRDRRDWRNPASGPPNGHRPGGGRSDHRRDPGGDRPRDYGPRDASPAPRRDPTRCYECGGAGHWAAECPSRVTCALCKAPGHTADACRKQCPACSKANPVGECPVAKALESLKVWTTAEENAVAASKLPVALRPVCNHRVDILLDSGSTTSILSLDLARRLGLQLRFDEKLKVKGIGDVTTYVTARTSVKITLGMSVVYYVNLWHLADQLVLWLCRSTKWVTTLITNKQGAPSAIRVVNISPGTVTLMARTAVAHLVEDGHLPSTPRCVRPGTVKYKEWQTLAHEASHSREFIQRELDAYEEYERSLPPVVERRSYPVPTRILQRPTPEAVDARMMLTQRAPASEPPETDDRLTRLASMFKVVQQSPEQVDYDSPGAGSSNCEELVADDQEPDIEAADVGEPGETTPEQREQVLAKLRQHRSAFLGSGNALPPPARGVHCGIEATEVAGQLVPPKASRRAKPALHFDVLNSTRASWAVTFDGSAKLKTNVGSASYILWELPSWDPVEAGASWAVTFDGSAKLKTNVGSASFILWELPSWDPVEAGGVFLRGVTVNEAEYSGLLAGLERARDRGIRELVVVGDSRCTGSMQCNQAHLQALLNRFRDLQAGFDRVDLVHVKRELNASADYLATKTLRTGSDWVVDDEQERQVLRELNGIPARLVKAQDDQGDQASEGDQADRHAAGAGTADRGVERPAEPGSDGEASVGAAPASIGSNRGGSGRAFVTQTRSAARRGAWSADRAAMACAAATSAGSDESARAVRSTAAPSEARESRAEASTDASLRRDPAIEGHVSRGSGNRQATSVRRSAGPSGPSPGNLQPEYPFQVVSMDFYPFQVVSMDFVGPLPASTQGNTMLLLFQDVFSGFVMCAAMSDTSAQAVAEAYDRVVFQRFGASSIIRHDRDPRSSFAG